MGQYVAVDPAGNAHLRRSVEPYEVPRRRPAEMDAARKPNAHDGNAAFARRAAEGARRRGAVRALGQAELAHVHHVRAAFLALRGSGTNDAARPRRLAPAYLNTHLRIP